MSQANPQRKRPSRTDQQHEHELDVDVRYEACGPIDPSSGSGVVDPWLRMQYPLEERGADEDGVIETAVNYRAEQHDDGSGVLMSHGGGAVYAVRLPDGTVIGNESRDMMWPYGSEMEGEVDYVDVPFNFVGGVLQEQTNIHTPEEGSLLDLGTRDGENTVEGRIWMRGVVDADILPDDHEESGVLLTHDSGTQVYVGWDSTSHTTGQNDLFGFVPFDGETGVRVPSATDALDLLKPHDAVARESVTRQGEWFAVDVDEEPVGSVQKPGVSEKDWRYSSPFTETDFDTRHEAVGAVTLEFDAGAISSVDAERTYTGGSPLESHVPRDYALGTDAETFLERVHEELDDLPSDAGSVQEVFDWLYETDAEPRVYERARELADGVYVRGTLRHRDNEHYVENAGEDWRRAVTHDWDVMTADSMAAGTVVVD